MPSSVSAAVPLVVQLLSPLPADEESALLTSCSLAHQSGECVRPADAGPSDTLRASIEFSTSTQVVLDISDEDPSTSLYVSRELFFESNDEPMERARAIGLALGVLATTLTESQAGQQFASDDDDVAEGEADAPNDEFGAGDPTDSDAQPLGRFALAAGLGGRWAPSWPAGFVSGALSGWVFPKTRWGLHVATGLSASPSADTRPGLSQLSVSVGPSLRAQRRRLSLWLAASGGIIRTQARLDDPDAVNRTGARVSPLFHVSATGGYQIFDQVHLTFLPAVDVVLSASNVVVDGQRLESAGNLQLSAQLGVMWTPSF